MPGESNRVLRVFVIIGWGRSEISFFDVGVNTFGRGKGSF